MAEDFGIFQPSLSRRTLLAAAGGTALVLASGHRAFSGGRGQEDQDRLHQPEDGCIGRVRPDRWIRARAGPQGAGLRSQDWWPRLRGHHPGPRHAIRPVAREPAREIPDQHRPGRPDAGSLNPRDDQSGRGRLRGCRRAVPVHRHAMGSLVFRAAVRSRAHHHHSSGPTISASVSASSTRLMFRNGS